MGTTALPQGVFFPEPDLMKSWIEGGGILIWTGALVGRYMGTAEGLVVDMFEDGGEGQWGPTFILGFDPIGEEGQERATVPTPWMEALDIRFPLATWGASVEDVDSRDGVLLGAATPGENPKASVSLLPVGEGALALFGEAPGPVFTYSAEDIIAHDIARLILSGILTNPRAADTNLLATRDVSLERGEKARISLPLRVPENISSLQVLVFSQVDFDPLNAVVSLEI